MEKFLENGRKLGGGAGYCPPAVQVPRDSEDPDFVLSFNMDQKEEYVKFFNEYGFVVVNVLTQEECKKSIEDIWNYLETKGWIHIHSNADILSRNKISRDDPSTWGGENWPAMAEEGILGVPPVFSAQAIANRQHPNVYKVFADLLGRTDLLVNHDRYGLFRPTKDVEFLNNSNNNKKENGSQQDNKNPNSNSSASNTDSNANTKTKKKDKPEWKTIRNVHLDMNPWTFVQSQTSEYGEKVLSSLTYSRVGEFIEENNHVGVLANFQLNLQGLINFADNREQDGGFHLVPGFQKNIVEWTQKTDKLKQRYGRDQTFIVLPTTEPIQHLALRITVRAGSMVIWDQRVAHGSAPNDSNRARFAQFLKMFPATPIDPTRAKLRAEKLSQKISECGVTVSELGEKLFGLKPWPAP